MYARHAVDDVNNSRQGWYPINDAVKTHSWTNRQHVWFYSTSQASTNNACNYFVVRPKREAMKAKMEQSPLDDSLKMPNWSTVKKCREKMAETLVYNLDYAREKGMTPVANPTPVSPAQVTESVAGTHELKTRPNHGGKFVGDGELDGFKKIKQKCQRFRCFYRMSAGCGDGKGSGEGTRSRGYCSCSLFKNYPPMCGACHKAHLVALAVKSTRELDAGLTAETALEI
jgi:hypothetical protein